jgi:CYTH domain-containing protein
MPVERRFVLASSLARLLQREGGPADRLIEAHFPARSDRTQLVRVEHGRASLILCSTTPDRQASEEAVEVPLSHAEALVEVAAGTVAFDRTALPLGTGIEGVLDRYILPQGLDLLTVTITGDPRHFAPAPWLGPEVTGDAAFEARELAINGLPAIEEVKVTNAALEALLYTLEGGRITLQSRAPETLRARRMPAPSAALAPPEPPLDVSSLPAPPASFTPERPTPPLAQEVVNDDNPASSASAVPHEGSGPQAVVDAPAEDNLKTGAADANTGDTRVEAAIERLFTPPVEPARVNKTTVNPQEGAVLPDVEDGPALGSTQPTAARRPTLRTNIRELDDGIARLARSLAPRGPRSPQ